MEINNKFNQCFISIVIPTLNRADKLDYCLTSLTAQISLVDVPIEIIVSNNCSTDGTPDILRSYADRFDYFSFVDQAELLKVEQSALAAVSLAVGEYVWIFGDDDYLEPGGLKRVLEVMASANAKYYVLNRSRSNDDLSRRITDNWMNLAPDLVRRYPRLLDFTREWGLFSVIGFYNASLFRRAEFAAVDAQKYCGKNLYAHVGALMEAFANEPVVLIGQPIFCHRTISDRKNRSFANDGVSRSHLKVAFGIDGIGMAVFLEQLVKSSAFEYDDIARCYEFLDKMSLAAKLVKQVQACEDRNLPSPPQRRYYQALLRKIDWADQDVATVEAVQTLLATTTASDVAG